MIWQPGQPVVTAADVADWQVWKRTSKLKAQRQRRAQYRRIDYYPGNDAQAIIDARTRPSCGGDYSSVIDALLLAGASAIRNRD